jgi:hypothetical protein
LRERLRVPHTRPVFKKCYARHLGGCNHKSQEHFISRSILEIIGTFEVGGFPWTKPGKTVSASARSLTASVLCERHNSSLSDLDSEASRLMSHLKLLDNKATAQELMTTPEVFVVDGVRFEKWLLKALCGIMSSGNFLIDGKSFGKIQATPYFVDLLFASEPWKPGIGLYFEYGHERLNTIPGVGYNVVLKKGGTHAEIAGIDMWIWGFPLRGLFATYEEGIPLPNFRPRRIRIVNQDVHRDVLFTWPAGSITSEGPILTRDGTLPS